ncbi:MAG: glycosyltransferase [Rhodospirillales bacterium]|nr:glycosyltransferase [Rhodospirillales bacterium]
MVNASGAAAQLGLIVDEAWYLRRYPDVIGANLSAVEHFARFGVEEGRDPNPFFDGAWYAAQNPDIAALKLHPLLHYLRLGAAALRDPSPRFDAAWYVAEHPEAAANPLLFHLRQGQARGYATEPRRAIAEYLPVASRPPPPPARPGLVVDVVIPVYRGLAETQRCLSSVLNDPARPPGRVIVIDDHSPEKPLSAWLDGLAASGRIVLLRNGKNLGFVASVNRGMEAAGRADVVLLNSDTEVPPGWLARLTAQAYAGPRIASVSPFSNNATICSYPDFAGGGLAFGMDVAALDAACARANPGRFVAVPTTVGFCMYIRRAALDDVGVFDVETFGRGYGEECDFCMRAEARAWQHRLACDVFVYHAGAVSFGPGAKESGKAAALISARHPTYDRKVATFVQRDPTAPSRFALTAAIFAASALPVILLVAHGLGGGVRRHLRDLVAGAAGRAHFLLLDAGARGAELSVPALPGHPVLSLAPDRVADMAALLLGFGVARVHLHHLMGMEMDVRALIHALGVPFDTTVHDYYAICPQVNLLPHPDGNWCGEPGPAVCNACIAARPNHGARDIHAWRLGHAWMLAEAARLICPSADVAARLARFGHPGGIVVPHETLAPPAPRLPRLKAKEALRVAVLGVLSAHKGRALVLGVAAAVPASELEIELIGYPEDPLPAWAKKRIRVTGRYEESDLPGLLARHAPHLVWFPQQWPETYSYTLSAALAAGSPVAATRLGALTARLAGRAGTWLIDANAGSTEWQAAFQTIAAALRSGTARAAKSARPAPPRRPAGAFYPDAYLAPFAPAPAPAPGATVAPAALSRATSSRAAVPVKPALRAAHLDLRRRGRIAAVIVPERYDDGAPTPCGHIRLLLPMEHLAARRPIDLVLASPAEALRYRADLLITQRHAAGDAAAARALLAHAKASGARLIYDLDDDLVHLPRDHADAARLRPLAPMVRGLLGGADAVWTSTAALGAAVAPLSRHRPAVLANALDERLWQAAPAVEPPLGGTVRLLMMGTATHGADMAEVLPALERLVDELGTRVAIDVIGMTAGEELPEWINRIAVPRQAGLSYPGFVDWFSRRAAWQIGVVPLADTGFNRAKSAIKTLDFAALGLAVLASDVPAYQGSLAAGKAGMLVANTTDAWFAALLEFVRNDAKRAAAQAAARAGFARHTLAALAPGRLKAVRAALAPG